MNLKHFKILSIVLALVLVPVSALSEELTGTWKIKVNAGNYSNWVIDVAEDLTATLLSTTANGDPEYKQIVLERRDGKLVVSFEHIQSCGNRIFEFILKGKEDRYKG